MNTYFALFIDGERVDRNFTNHDAAVEYVKNTPTIEVGAQWDVSQPYFFTDGRETGNFRTVRFGSK